MPFTSGSASSGTALSTSPDTTPRTLDKGEPLCYTLPAVIQAGHPETFPEPAMTAIPTAGDNTGITPWGLLAQLVEQLTLNQRVTGSNPVASTIFADSKIMQAIVYRENPERNRM